MSEFNFCACIGAYPGDPACPCRMKQMGLTPKAPPWDEEAFRKAMRQVYQANLNRKEAA